jgi:hypothetical protein
MRISMNLVSADFPMPDFRPANAGPMAVTPK